MNCDSDGSNWGGGSLRPLACGTACSLPWMTIPWPSFLDRSLGGAWWVQLCVIRGHRDSCGNCPWSPLPSQSSPFLFGPLTRVHCCPGKGMCFLCQTHPSGKRKCWRMIALWPRQGMSFWALFPPMMRKLSSSLYSGSQIFQTPSEKWLSSH